MKHTGNIFKTIALAVALIAAGYTTAQAETVTYTISGNTEQNGNVNFTVTASGSVSGSVSDMWAYASTQSRSITLPGSISLSFGSDKPSSMAVKGYLQIEATGSTGGYITLSHASKYIYHITLKNNSGDVIHEAWNLAKSYTYRFQSIGVNTIVVEYATTIPITDAQISGVNSQYFVSNTAVAPVPTVKWHGTTLTKNTHYTLSYQNNTAAGTATVKATGKGVFSSSTNVSKNYTLVWATYTLRLHHNDGTEEYTDMAMTYGVAANIQEISRTGYTINGFSTTASGSVEYTAGQSVINLTTENGAVVDLYAQWSANTYTVHFDANGGTGTMSDQSFTYGVEQALNPNAFTKENSDFVLWSTVDNGSGDGYTDKQVVSNLTATNGATVTLYAQWFTTVGFCGHSNINNGTDVTWKVTDTDNNGTYETLTISGTGPTNNYSLSISARPWFAFLSDITTVVVEDGVTSLGKYFLKDHSALTSVTIASSVNKIDNGAFSGCNNLTAVNGASGVTSIGERAFNGTDGTKWKDNLPDGLTYVGHVAYLFKGDGTSVTLDENTTQIAEYAFKGSNITSIDIPSNVKTIGEEAFEGCANLTSVTIGNGVQVIKAAAFSDTRLTTVTIPSSMTSIEVSAFETNYFNKAYILSSTPFSISMHSFPTCSIIVPAVAYNKYRNNWTSHQTDICEGYTVTGGSGVSIISTTNNGPWVESGETVTFRYSGTGEFMVRDVNNQDIAVEGNSGVYTFTMPNSDVAVISPTEHSVSLTLFPGTKDGVSAWWGTFYGGVRYTLPEGAAAYTMDSHKNLYRLGTDGRVIPAGVGVVIIAENNNVTLTIANSTTEVKIHHGQTNLDGYSILMGSNSATTVTEGKIGKKTPCVLSVKGGTVDFYPLSNDYNGIIPAHKAYYLK